MPWARTDSLDYSSAWDGGGSEVDHLRDTYGEMRLGRGECENCPLNTSVQEWSLAPLESGFNHCFSV